MKVVFAGTPEFAQTALQQLLRAQFDVPLVLTQPDRPAGRGMKLQASPVKQTAMQHQIPVAQPHSLRLDGRYAHDAQQARQALLDAAPDVMVVAAYGLILPQWVLDLPRLGCLNIHASLLPRWRGAAPIHRAIEAGDAETGICIMQMDTGLDTGDVLLTERLAITPTDTTATLHDKLATLGARLIVEALEIAACGRLHPQPQPDAGVTYAHKIQKTESTLDWTQPAVVLERRLRAFNPFPGCTSSIAPLAGKPEVIKIWSAQLLPAQAIQDTAVPGQVLAVSPSGIDVACGTDTEAGVLRLTELQRAGSKRLPAADWLRGFTITPGMVWGAAQG